MQPLTTLITGGTGSIGPDLLARLIDSGIPGPVGVLIRPQSDSQSAFTRLLNQVLAALSINSKHTLQTLAKTLIPVPGDITHPSLTTTPLCLSGIRLIIHAAADTRFRAPLQDLQAINVQGTRHVLSLARQCPRLQRLVYVSTCCVAGTSTGLIAEDLTPTPPGFLNPYEQSKWQAEQYVSSSALPFTIARLSTVVGSQLTGAISRPGALHHALKWMYRGLVPMVPGQPDTHVDLISSQYAAAFLSQLALAPGPVAPVIHIAAGPSAVTLSQLLALCVQTFKQISPSWLQGQIAPPMTVDSQTYALFQDSINQSGDVLFKSVLDSSSAFLPGLIHPKTYQTTRARQLFDHPPASMDWRRVLPLVIAQAVGPAGPVVRLHSRETHP